jgi:glycine oxidase
MSEVKGLRVVVAGAGAIGSVCALVLARRGAKVVLADPAAPGDNASGVAAGMLAPVSEALFDATSEGHLPLLRTALQAWDRLLPDLAASLDRSGAVIEAGDAEAVLKRARSLGASLELIAAGEARRLCPGLGPPGPFLFTPEDWRLDARTMLASLHQALRAEGGELLRSDIAGGPPAGADVLVQATGPGPGLTPIKGQILLFAGTGPARGPVVRGQGIYVAPSAAGSIAGATMEEGRADREIEAEAVERLRERAVRLFPALADAQLRAFAGVRAATPDGLPLVGPMGEPGVLVARGARRNGWLLAPLIAEVVIERMCGPATSTAAAAFDPARLP